MHRRMPVGVDVHPACAYIREYVHAAPELGQAPTTNLFDTAGNRQIKRGVAHYPQAMPVQRGTDGWRIHSP